MTGTREPQQDGGIQAMLRDSGLEAAAELRRSLEELRALVPDEAPAPRADLAALLASGSCGSAVESAPDFVDEPLPAGVTSLAERRGRKRRLAIVGGAVLGAMTLGAGAVAASSGNFRESFSQSVGTIFQPGGKMPDTAQRPARPSPADVPAAPAPTSNATGAATPPQAEAPGAPGAAAAVPAKPGAPATPPAVGHTGFLPTPPHRPVTPGTPALPVPGGDKGLPAGPALPGVLPALPGQP
ncbi:hypothetical protein [Arthrobacter sp. PsM3]|uniref:hypothetical protein n=1 Tax=Arthrobacter sp. PsM3 TaxID=3030531 RepID=UPI00263B11A9|nr:hypothetical protein [Arthrobacter sp. PsM3]MDN4645593.1 hypothetical protein [Arthrobacter sp. PsM3]